MAILKGVGARRSPFWFFLNVLAENLTNSEDSHAEAFFYWIGGASCFNCLC